MAINSLIMAGDTIRVSKSFGVVGSAVVGRSKTPIIVVAANNNDPVTTREISINKPLVKMIIALASIDGFLKQKLQNQKIIDRNEQLNRREAQIEQQDSTPQVEVIKPDAERVDGSSAGLMAVGALFLLTLDPVQKAIGDIADGVISMGKFVTGIAKTLNDVFSFFVGGNNETVSTAVPTAQPAENRTPPPAPASAVDATPMPTITKSAPSPTAEAKPSFLSSVGSGALTGAAVGSFVPKVGVVAGATVGGVAGAVSYFTGGSSSSASMAPAATQTSAPTPTSNSSTPATPAGNATGTTATGEIPKNDIVALGNYLIGKGAERSKMQHPAFGSVGEHSKNSRHYRGMAIDVNFPGPNEGAILDALEPQLRAAGYNTIWRKPGHETHMHVSVGGPEGSGGGSYGDASNGLGESIAKVATTSLEQVGKLFGVLGGAIIKPGIPRNDIPNTIASATRQINADVAVAKTEKPVTPPPAPKPPNINKSAGGATENPATQADKNSVYYYLRRFGYQDLNITTT